MAPTNTLRFIRRPTRHPHNLSAMPPITLTKDQIELILYCLEQQEYEFNLAEQADCEAIIDKLTTAQSQSS